MLPAFETEASLGVEAGGDMALQAQSSELADPAAGAAGRTLVDACSSTADALLEAACMGAHAAPAGMLTARDRKGQDAEFLSMISDPRFLRERPACMRAAQAPRRA